MHEGTGELAGIQRTSQRGVAPRHAYSLTLACVAAPAAALQCDRSLLQVTRARV